MRLLQRYQILNAFVDHGSLTTINKQPIMAVESLMQTYPMALNIISFCWILFAVIWLLAAFATKQTVYQESRLQRLRYMIPILVGGFLLAKGRRLSDPL